MGDQKPIKGMFARVFITLGVVYALVQYGIPIVSRKVTGLDFPMTVPSTLFLFYTILVLIGTFVYVTSDEASLESFMSPIKKTLGGEYGNTVSMVSILSVTLLSGLFVFNWVKPTVASPVGMRIQHPSSNFPKKFEAVENPLANPTDAEVDEFIEQVKNNNVKYFPQVHQVNMKFTNVDHIPTAPVKEFLKQLKSGNIDKKIARDALMEKRLFEGRALYQINCRPCHGTRTTGDGPLAYGFKLRPINFTDNGTIEVIVEGYTFWRVQIGGLGLPVESTPWDSAMPVWGLDLTEEERWSIILGEYNLAEKTPRIREKLE